MKKTQEKDYNDTQPRTPNSKIHISLKEILREIIMRLENPLFLSGLLKRSDPHRGRRS